MSNLTDVIAAFAVEIARCKAENDIFEQFINGAANAVIVDGNGQSLPSIRSLIVEAVAVTVLRDAAAQSAADALAYANVAGAAASGDALYANVFVSPKIMTDNLTILATQNAMIMHERIAQGVTLRVQGTVRIIN